MPASGALRLLSWIKGGKINLKCGLVVVRGLSLSKNSLPIGLYIPRRVTSHPYYFLGKSPVLGQAL